MAGVFALGIAVRVENRTTAAAGLPVSEAPVVPEWVQGRPEAEEVIAMVSRRRWGAGDAVGITTGLHGAGGFGKTTLARVVCADRRIRRRFGGRVYLVTIGRDVRGRAAVAAKVAEVTRYLTGDTRETGSDPDLAGAHLGGLLSQRPRMLLVLDDVWEAEQLEPFLQGAEGRCVRLVTTRRPEALPIGAARVMVDRMTREQAQAVLTHNLPPLPEALVRALVAATGQWALLLRMANQRIAAQTATGADVAVAAQQLLEQLRAGGPASADDPDTPLDLDDPVRRSLAVQASIKAATTLLPADGARRFSELGIFAEDEAISLHLIARLWQAADNLTESQARTLCKQMADLSLLTLDTTVPGGAARLHDVVRDYLRAELADDLATVNGLLVDALVADLPNAPSFCTAYEDLRAWWQIPEGYLRDHLIEHLMDAGRTNLAEAVASDLRWIRARLDQRGLTAPRRDLNRVGTSTARALAEELVNAHGILSRTDPPHVVESVLRSRLLVVPHWASQTDAFPLAFPSLTDRWAPPDSWEPAPLAGATAEVNGVAVGPDGTWLVTGDRDGKVRIWDASGTLTRTLDGHTGAVNVVAISADGTWFATGGRDGRIRIWDPESGSLRHTMTSYAGAVKAVAISPDGTWFATSSRDGRVRIWDPTTGVCRHTFNSRFDGAVAVSPDGSWLVTGDVRAVQIWTSDGNLRQTIYNQHGAVNAVAISPDGAWFATGGHDGMVRVWDPAGTLIHTFAGHVSAVNAVAISPDGAWFATGGHDRAVRVWDPAGTLIHTFAGHISAVNAVAISPDGAWFATGGHDGMVRVWDPAEILRRDVTRQPGVADAVVVRPERIWLATGGDDRTVRILDPVAESRRTPCPDHIGNQRAVAVSQDGTWLATGSHDGAVQVWTLPAGTLRRTLVGHSSKVNAVAISPDGAWIATGGDDRAVRIWDPSTGTCTRIPGYLDGAVYAVAINPEAEWIATGSRGGTACIWDCNTGTLRHSFTGHDGAVYAVAVSPDGTWLATGSQGGTVRIWDCNTGTLHRTLAGHTGAVTAIAASPDGTWLVTGSRDGTARIWQSDTGTLRHTLVNHEGRVNAVAVSPHGNWLTTSSKHVVRIWDPTTGEPLTLMRTEGNLFSCAWGPDNRSLFAAGDQGLHGYDFHPSTPGPVP
ncbi:NB-ARC domain-containing protein [Streptomyces sp. NPDC096193]|uniref:NB-ARC domain-containing protein n=1 Tax=Streptomyces sp. NPDC096193 TaxID=3155821 RepID=UPI00331A5602